MNYKNHTNCRVCGSSSLIPYLNLGNLPLSNNLAVSSLDPIHNERYPLEVMLCENCGLSQLSVVVNPEVLFSHYVYRSSISRTYMEHCKEMAESLKEKHGLSDKSFHIDIAGNDGALLFEFKRVLNHKVLNIDPALNLAPISEAMGVPVLSEFWGIDTALKILNRYGVVDLITATNVFAHVDNVKDFILAAKLVLRPETGVLVLEFPYLVDFIDNKEFDTVYFEHLSYFSIYPITLLCEQVGLQVMDVEKQDIHGGTVRVTIGYGKENENVFNFIKNEKIYYSDISVYKRFARDVQNSINNFKYGINKLDGMVAGFAASAKGNTLLNSAGITVGSLKYIVDETPEKIGKYSPGTRIPIVPLDILKLNPPDYLVLLSWNFAKEIMSKLKDIYKGKHIIPIPEFKIIEN